MRQVGALFAQDLAFPELDLELIVADDLQFLVRKEIEHRASKGAVETLPAILFIPVFHAFRDSANIWLHFSNVGI